MNNRWKIWIYPVGCLVVIAILLIFVLTASGCSASSSTGNDAFTQQAYASESTSTDTSKQVLVCSHLGVDASGGNDIDFARYSAVIWVEPVSQNVFSVTYACQRHGDGYRIAIGPLQAGHGSLNGPMRFNDYKLDAKAAGYTLIYEDE